jgi:potassium-transporting ATPase KdpC subunit
MRRFIPELGIAIRLTIVIMVVTGLIYPLVMTGIAQGVFHDRAEGSLVHDSGGNVIGSSLIGQSFTSDKYFHSRPSATTDANGTPQPYNAANSSASNLGPTNPVLIANVQQYSDAVRCTEGLPPGPPPIVTPTPAPSPASAASPTPPTPTSVPCSTAKQPQQDIPVDAVTTSGSGLDPDISVDYALLQVARVAQARHLTTDQVQQLVQNHTFDRQFGILGERRVNVLDLNIALDALGGG